MLGLPVILEGVHEAPAVKGGRGAGFGGGGLDSATFKFFKISCFNAVMLLKKIIQCKHHRFFYFFYKQYLLQHLL